MPSIALGKAVSAFGILVLALLVAYLWTHPPAGVAESKREAKALPAPADGGEVAADDQGLMAPTAFPPLAAYGEIAARPLFSHTRRPPEVKIVAAKKEPPPKATKQTFALTGVLVTPHKRVAMLKPEGGGKTLRVVEGRSVEGWRVESVKARSVVLTQGGKRQELKLQVKINKAAKSESNRTARSRSARRAERRRSTRRDSGGRGGANTPPAPVTKGGAK